DDILQNEIQTYAELQKQKMHESLREQHSEWVEPNNEGTTCQFLNMDASTREQLEALRQQIDLLDERIVELVQERAQVVKEVGNIKREAHLPVTVARREKHVMERVQELAKGGPLPADAVGCIYQTLVKEMRNWEAKLDASATLEFSS